AYSGGFYNGTNYLGTQYGRTDYWGGIERGGRLANIGLGAFGNGLKIGASFFSLMNNLLLF
ncbi:unnamed protein product, partial [Rotaria sp. Silwood1]